MAGTLQTLILSPPPSISRRPSPCNLCSPAYRTLLSDSSLRITRSRLVLRPIIACKASSQFNEGGSKDAARTHGSVKVVDRLLRFAGNNFLPLALIGGVALGLANPSLGCLADRYHLSKFSTFGIFIVSGLTLRSEEIGAAAESWPVGIFGLASILLFTPYFSKLILQIQLQPQEFVTGLAIFSCMPTTLSSGVALTQLAGGNAALALAMTVISNLLGILIGIKLVTSLHLLVGANVEKPVMSYLKEAYEVPFSISKLIAGGVGVTVPTKQLFKSLVLTLLIPLILGKVVRESVRGLPDFVDNNKKLFAKISAFFLGLVPWIQVSRSRSLLLLVQPEVFVIAIGMGIILHLILLAFNVLAIQCLSTISGGEQSVFARKDNASAALLVASQKTLPVMVAVVEQLGGAFGESGLLVLPCVSAHLVQIIMDSFLVNFWLRKDVTSSSVKIA